MNVLLHTWWFSKYKGSECSVAYNFVRDMSKYHHLYIALESNSLALDDLDEMNEYNTLKNCEFIIIKPTKLMLFFKKINKNKKGILAGWSTYIWFNLWERELYKLIKNSDILNKIDVIHYLGPVGYHEPGYLYKLRKKYIWGPVSGFENANRKLVLYYYKSKYLILFKGLINNLHLIFSRRLKKVIKNCDIIIAATESNKKIIEKRFNCKNVTKFHENLMRINWSEIRCVEDIRRKYRNVEVIEIVWVGSLVPRKMPNLFLDSIKYIKNREKIRVSIIGSGDFNVVPYKDYDCVHFVGNVSRDEVLQYFKNAHLSVITSSHEATTTIIWEAMENCVPTITTDICGMADVVIDKVTGFKIKIDDYEIMCKNIAEKINEIVDNPRILEDLALNLRENSINYTTDKREEFFNSLYKKLEVCKL